LKAVVPGTGHTNFAEIIRVVRTMNCQRYIALDQNREDRQDAHAAVTTLQRLLEE
jgi:sugar phosphate isomerase/epimerase